MNGAESLVRTLLAGGVDVCFTNPGTSEMHFVSALDRVPGMRCVLGLFEGVVTGAADAYYRMADKPAATLLHLGPGLGNGLANLHNAKKAGSGIVNIVGEHASYHIQHDAPLTADIEGIARPVSHWVKTSPNSRAIAADGAAAIAAARQAPGQIATLILPADTAWGPADGVANMPAIAARQKVAPEAVVNAARALGNGKRTVLLLGGVAVREKALALAGRIAAKSGCVVAGEYGLARLQRGAGRVQVTRVPYAVDAALAMFKDVEQIVLVGAKRPVSFFAYPDKPSVQAPAGCEFIKLAGIEEDVEAALGALADELGARNLPPKGVAELSRPALPEGKLNAEGIAAVLGATLPENAVVIDESVSTGRGFARLTTGAPPHDWLNIMGGAIGFGLPGAVGAAIGAPGRKVIALEGDGSAMYTMQALWTMARESLNVTVVMFANRSYQILRGELANVGGGTPGQRATDMLTLDRPDIDWVGLAKSVGVDGGRALDLQGLAREMQRGLASSGPYLIEVVL